MMRSKRWDGVIASCIEGRGEMEWDGSVHPYMVTSPELFPLIAGFTPVLHAGISCLGDPFVSSEVLPEYRRLVIIHELCRRKTGCHLRALFQELREMDSLSFSRDYASFRIDYFTQTSFYARLQGDLEFVNAQTYCLEMLLDFQRIQNSDAFS